MLLRRDGLRISEGVPLKDMIKVRKKGRPWVLEARKKGDVKRPSSEIERKIKKVKLQVMY